MKLNEFLSEDQLDEILGAALGAAARGIGRLAYPVGKKVDPTAVIRQAKIDRAGAIELAKQTKKIPIFGRWLAKMDLKRARTNFEVARTTAAQASLNNLGRSVIQIALAGNLIDGYLDYRASLEVLNSIDPRPEDYDKKLNELRGIFITQVLAPGVAVGATKIAGAVAKVLPSLLKQFRPTAQAGAKMTMIIDGLQKVSAAAMITYLASPDGIKKITDWLGTAFTENLGVASTMLWNLGEFVYAGLQVAGLIPKGDTQPTAQQAQPTQGAAPASQGQQGAGDIAGAIAKGGSIDDMAASILAGQMAKGLSN